MVSYKCWAAFADCPFFAIVVYWSYRPMKTKLRNQADRIVSRAIEAALPDAAVARALEGIALSGRVILIAVGKAAWQMANAAYGHLGRRIDAGMIISKYGHIKGPVGDFLCREAGHPVPDENGFGATREALELVSDLTERDTVLFLLSGGGSALFEDPLVPGEELRDITAQLLACGADITEINTIRKRLSAVKGGRFAVHCAPARVFSVVLSDIVGDPLDMIASGPACPDRSTCGQAMQIAEKYGLRLSVAARACLGRETPKVLSNVTTQIIGSVRELCAAAAAAAEEMGYETRILTDRLEGQAGAAGRYLAQIAKEHCGRGRKLAFIAGGETVVKVTGTGKGGRNQELALAAALEIDGMEGVCIFSVGSDGTDGPTDAAGGYVDGQTAQSLRSAGVDPRSLLRNNDAYHALRQSGGLIITGPTGTNVNDVAVALIQETIP